MNDVANPPGPCGLSHLSSLPSLSSLGREVYLSLNLFFQGLHAPCCFALCGPPPHPKNIQNSKLPKDLIITTTTHTGSPFAKLLNSQLNELRLIDTGKASFLCLVTNLTPAKQLSFYTIEKALENKLKNARINNQLDALIALKLKQAEYQNFLK